MFSAHECSLQAANHFSGFDVGGDWNRLTETGAAASTYAIASTNNRVSSITGALPRTYSYDTAGNVLTYATVTATYNNRGRMKTLANGAVTATYVYNALGQFVKQSGGPSGTVLYAYDEAGHLLGEYSSTGGLIQETIWMGDTPVATIRPGTPALIYYVHTDHLNTPRRVTRPSDNKLMWTWYSDPFGTDLPNENPASGGTFKYNLRFPGQLYDSHAGLNQNYFRDYDPQIGRYVESDPIGLRGGVNTYAYVGNNPISGIDPLGLAQGCGCSKSYIDCLADCIRAHDPLNNLGKGLATAVGGTFPKSWVGLPQGLGGASPVTTVPSAGTYATGGGASGTVGAAARAAGRVASPIWIGYGLYLFGMEVYCASSCAGDSCAH